MISFTQLLFPFVLLTTNIVTHAYLQTLEDCKAVAAKFNNTCNHGDYDTPAANMTEMAYVTFNCENKPRCIPSGVVSGNTCSWDRKLCVTCRNDNGVTKIRVQTNNLPNHCVQSDSIKAKNFDYEVVFNSKQTYGNWMETLSTQQQLNRTVCTIVKQYDASSLEIVENGDEESANAMGFAINGVAFQFANQIQEDPVYPITVLNEQPLDICLGHNQRNSDSGMYHYHDISPCINPNFLEGKTMASCEDNDDCKDDITQWAISGFQEMKYKKVIGIAKDGHVLYGPYDDSGQLWQTRNVDACNGAWSDDLGDYFYVGTQWHPYLVGCLGPSNFPHHDEPIMYAQCSLNGMDQYANISESTTSSATSPTTSPNPSPTITSNTSPTMSPNALPTTNPTMSPTTRSNTSPTISSNTSATTSLTMSPITSPNTSPTISSNTSPTMSSNASPTTSLTMSPITSPNTSPTISSNISPTMSSNALPTTNPTMPPTTSSNTSPTISSNTSATTSLTISPLTSPNTSPTISSNTSPTMSPNASPTTRNHTSPTTSPNTSPTINQNPSLPSKVMPIAVDLSVGLAIAAVASVLWI